MSSPRVESLLLSAVVAIIGLASLWWVVRAVRSLLGGIVAALEVLP
jgi:hypothetical protein